MANLYRNQRGWAEVEIGVISPYANKRIITPILETVRSSPRFIGGLVSSIIATIIADAVAVKVLLVTASVYKIIENYFVLPYIFVHTCPNFLQLQIHFKFCHRVHFYYCELAFYHLTYAPCVNRPLTQIRINFIASAHHTYHFYRVWGIFSFENKKTTYSHLNYK